MVRVRVGIGRRGGIRPGDLVGAIANEAGIDAKGIGAIDIADGYSLVEVDGSVADRVIAALAKTWLKGQRVHVGLESDGEPPAGTAEPVRRGPPRYAPGGPPRGKPPRYPRK